MKYSFLPLYTIFIVVAPLAGAWIEIPNIDTLVFALLVAPLAGAWIEILMEKVATLSKSRRSPRGSVD